MNKDNKNPVTKSNPPFPHKGCGVAGSRRHRKKTKGSATAGKIKGGGCNANWRQRGVCRVSRSYKWGDYDALVATLGKAKSK
jgi:hypothetical protein